MKMVVQSMAIVRNKITMPNTVHIAGRGSVVRQLRCENPPRQHVPTACFMQKITRQINYVFTKLIREICFF